MPSALERCFLVSVFVVALATHEASGLIVYGSDPTDTSNTLNTNAPDNGAPWFNVVQFGANNATGIYLGNGFVLTANHVNVVDSGIVINGAGYNRDTAFAPLQITEENAATPYADVVDLKLVKILGNPSLPAFPVVQKLPLNFSTIDDLNAASTMMGWGVGKGAIVENQGWRWGGNGTRAQRWGTNFTFSSTDDSIYTANATYHYEMLGTSFLRSLGSDTADVTLGDSGGGLFQQFSGTWKLSGITTVVASYVTNAAIYDGMLATEGDQPDEVRYVRMARYAHLLRYENWANLNLGSPIALETADDDGDGVPNLQEYAFHTDPNSAASFSVPRVGFEPGFVTLTYPKLLSATDLRYEIEATDQLRPADWQVATTTDEIVSTSGLVRTIKAKVAITSETRKFLRLRVTRLF